MSKIKVLIVDDNIMTAQSLYDKLNDCEDFEMLDIAKDGLEAIEQINKLNPDVVLLDIIMPKLDGIGVLEHAKNSDLDKRPVYIVYSAVSQENYVARAMNLGANYYIIKPFDESVLSLRIRQLYTDYKVNQYPRREFRSPLPQKKNRYDDELKVLATKYMREFGLKAHMIGYSYIRDIVTDSFDSYCINGTLPKGIYRETAEKNNVSVQKVERAIRNCIENVLSSSDKTQKKPTNSQVICQLIDKIRTND